MDNADRTHWRRIRETKSRERKKLKDKNNGVYHNFRSNAYKEAQREIYRQEWERNEKAIKKLEDEIYIIDCKLRQKSPDRNVHVDRGRSKTPEPTACNVAQAPAERRSRSSSRGRSKTPEPTAWNVAQAPAERRSRSSSRSRQSSAKCQEKLLEYQEENRHLRDKMSKILKQHQPLRQKIVEAEGKYSSLSVRLRIESEEKSRLKRENTLLQTQLNSIKREREWNDESNEKRLTKIIEENDRLKEELFTYQRESLKVPALQQNEIEMRQQLDEMKKRIEKLKTEKRENETTLLSTRNQQKETDMTLKIDDNTKRNEQLQKEKSADKSILLSLQDYKAEITQLQSIIRSKMVVEDRLRQTIGDLEKKCETIQRDVYERLHEDRDKKKKQLKEGNDKELQRLRQLEIMHENNIKSMRSMESNHTDLEKKNQQLQAEKDMLLKRESMQQNETQRLQNKLDAEERESVVLRERIKELERQNVPRYDLGMIEENWRLLVETEQLKKDFSECKQQFAENEETLRRYTRQVESLQREKRQAIAEKESALTRLNALAGDRLWDNNAAIAELSDENRPINLGKKFSELYDNQWTDAIEKLEKLMSERDAIQNLLEMIKDIYDVCRKLAKDQLDQIAKAFGFEERKEKLKRLKDFRKSMASENIGDIKKKVDDLCVSKTFSRESSDCTSYISRSVELCWYMCIQDPPVILEFNATHGQVFDDKIYRHFTKSGKTIDYMVWPVMYLHSNGPLLQKGVVQPM